MRVKFLAALTASAFLALVLHLYLQHRCKSRIQIQEKNVEVLLDELSSFQTCIKSQAAFDLQKVGPMGVPAVPQLTELLRDKDPSVRWRSVAALGTIGYFPEDVKKAIYRAFDDTNETVRFNTLFAMSLMGYEHTASKKGPFKLQEYKETEDGFAVFLKALDDQSPKVVFKALLHIDPSQINKNGLQHKAVFQDKIFKLTNSRDSEIRAIALIRLGNLLGTKEVLELLPNYKQQIIELQAIDNEIIKKSAKKMLASLEGKELPILFYMAEAETEKYKKECEEGGLSSCYHYGDFLLYQNKTDEAFEIFNKSCNQGNGAFVAGGCEKLGERYLKEGEKEKAKYYYKLAVNSGQPQLTSTVKLGDILKGEGNTREACIWYFRSCRRGAVEACVKSQECPSEIIPAEPEGAASACDQGNNSACERLAKHYEDSHDREKALHYRQLLCNRGQTENSCHDYLQRLMFLSRWDDYRVQVEKLCAKEERACIRLGTLAELKGDTDKALQMYESLCFSKKLHKACNLMRRLVVSTRSVDQQKQHFQDLCETKKEESSCFALGMLFHKENNFAKRDKYLNIAKQSVQQICAGENLEYCAVYAMLECATGNMAAGEIEFQRLCSQRSKYCKAQDLCRDALNQLEQKFSSPGGA